MSAPSVSSKVMAKRTFESVAIDASAESPSASPAAQSEAAADTDPHKHASTKTQIESTVFHLHKRVKTGTEGVLPFSSSSDVENSSSTPMLLVDSVWSGSVSAPPTSSAEVEDDNHAHATRMEIGTQQQASYYSNNGEHTNTTIQTHPQPQSILASMTAQSNPSSSSSPSSSPLHHPYPHPSSFPYTLPPVSAIRSPRRALVCASLESAASALTHTSIHPAILHSLSIRLQAMNDREAEIVLKRLQNLAHHIDQQKARQQENGNQQQQQTQQTTSFQPQQLQPQHEHILRRSMYHSSVSGPSSSSSSKSLYSPVSLGSSSSLPPGSPSLMPSLASISSIDSSGNTSNTTSPTISPAVRARTPPKTPSPTRGGNIHAGGSGGSNAAPTRSTQHLPPHHPPLHPPTQHANAPGNTSLSHTVPTSTHHPTGVDRSSFPPSTSSVAVGTSTSIQLDSIPPAQSLTRGVSEDSSHIPLGLMMLIDALPGSSVGPLTAAGDLAGSALQRATANATNTTNAINQTINNERDITDASMLDAQSHKQRVDAGTNTTIVPFSGIHKMIGLPIATTLRRSTSF